LILEPKNSSLKDLSQSKRILASGSTCRTLTLLAEPNSNTLRVTTNRAGLDHGLEYRRGGDCNSLFKVFLPCVNADGCTTTLHPRTEALMDEIKDTCYQNDLKRSEDEYDVHWREKRNERSFNFLKESYEYFRGYPGATFFWFRNPVYARQEWDKVAVRRPRVGYALGADQQNLCGACAGFSIEDIKKRAQQHFLESVSLELGPETDYAWERYFLLGEGLDASQVTRAARIEAALDSSRRKVVREAIRKIETETGLRDAFQELEFYSLLLNAYVRLAFPVSISMSDLVPTGSETKQEFLRAEFVTYQNTAETYPDSPNLLLRGFRNEALLSSRL
jgi:hypothetical protein